MTTTSTGTRHWHAYGSREEAMKDPAYRALRSKDNPEFHPDEEADIADRISRRESGGPTEQWDWSQLGGGKLREMLTEAESSMQTPKFVKT